MADEDETPKIDPNGTAHDVPLRVAVVSIAAFFLWSLAVSIAHAFVKQFDLTSVILAEVAIAPVLVFLFSNIEIDYGKWKVALKPKAIQLRAIKRAFANVRPLMTRTHEITAQVLEARGVLTAGASGTVRALGVVTTDASATVVSPSESAKAKTVEKVEPTPSLALESVRDDVVFVRLRSEIDKRLRSIAEAYGVAFKPSTQGLLTELQARGIIKPNEAEGLWRLIMAGDAQLHGSTTPPGIAEFAREEGDRLLAALDSLALEPKIDLVNLVLEKAGTLDRPINLPRGEAGIVIPGEVAIEVKSGRLTKLGRTLALQKLRVLVRSGEVRGGILVLPREPEGAEKDEGAKSDFELGFAWKLGDGFDGDATARKLAPWLFA